MPLASLDEAISERTTRFVTSTTTADETTVQAHFADQRVAITLDSGVGASFAGQMILFTLLNLLVRLGHYTPALDVILSPAERHPLLRLLSPGSFSQALEEFFAPFPASSRLRIASTPTDATASTLHILISPLPAANAWQVWVDGWIIYVNTEAPFRSEVANSVGACVAADFAAAEVFKRLMRELPLRPGQKILPIERLIFSSYDYRLSVGPNPALPTTINMDGVVVVGLGGIGAGFVAAASSLPELTGMLTLVDKDPLDPTNLNRLLYARPGDSGYKVELSRHALAFHHQVDARAEWYDEFTAARGNRQDLVVVGVDKDRARRAIQSSMPSLILNAGTSDMASFHVTRHDYLQGACLSCIATAEPEDHPAERELARQLGLDLETILQFEASQEPIPSTLLRTGGALTEEDIVHLGGRPLAAVRARVCAELPLGVGEQQEAVSISFLSALPGFLLLGEVIKERSYPTHSRPPLNETTNYLLLSLLGRPRQELLSDWRSKSDSCDCVRPVYQRNYRRKWGLAPRR